MNLTIYCNDKNIFGVWFGKNFDCRIKNLFPILRQTETITYFY